MRIVFDLDGTLVDTLPEIHGAATAMLTEFGHEALPTATIRRFIGHGVEALVGQVHDTVRGAEDRAIWVEVFNRHYARINGTLVQPFDGVTAALRVLGDGARMGICTNKPEALARGVVEALRLGPFEALIGGDTMPVRKPDPAPLLAVAEALGEGPILYVGDGEVDAETAARAGIDFALFTGGYRKAEPEDLPHRLRFDHWADLAALVQSIR
ncbi:phosphoglycolate phosphatase [Falsirhodobacter algicola]|uniref:phosphoglycolate phosphatase n=1 Tax=Falsirhodobacter algicola TaxID=2692330 RepID=A0A8J8MR66_9RHOB|nr:phosphoglycolate phosphatase [Falsirhodobacter algicola]QUS34957.1 phosphoglycolate phosphatase [Falsirhodobacter algicola]